MYKKPFKILGISSGRPMGNAEIMLRECLMECEKLGEVDVRITRLRTLKIGECTGCMECMKDLANGGNGSCVMHDELEWLKEQILWADAIVFSVPCFCYVPTAEVFTLMNRAMGAGKDYLEACRANPKLVGLICVGGSDTVDFHLPMQYKALHAICPGFELVDQCYANWIRGKGYIAAQEYHMDRARLQAKRLMNRFNGYKVPTAAARIMKLNPMEYKDDVYVELEACPVCYQSVVEMDSIVFANGRFRCAVCGATGHVEHHGGRLTYVWDDDTVAHNRLHPEHDAKHVADFIKAHAPKEGPKADVPEFPVISPASDVAPAKPRITAVVAAAHGGTTELLARQALAAATADGKFEGVLINLLDLNIHFCTGCLLCKVNARYRGGVDKCVLKDDDLWVVEHLAQSAGIIYALDSVNGFTYGKAVALMERFGHGYITRTPLLPKANGVMISSFDDDVKSATFTTNHLINFYCAHGPNVAEELFTNVPLVGNGILADPQALGRAAGLGTAVARAAGKILADPANMAIIRPKVGMCPSCGLDLIELRPDMTVSCARCDAHGQIQHRFGENVVVWDNYDVTHSRNTAYGGMLHFKHINYSQTDDNAVLSNPKVHEALLAPYTAYGKLVKPGT